MERGLKASRNQMAENAFVVPYGSHYWILSDLEDGQIRRRCIDEFFYLGL